MIVNIAKGTMDQRVELVWKAEKDNAEVSMENVEEYQKMVGEEWNPLRKAGQDLSLQDKDFPVRAAYRRRDRQKVF